MTRVSEAMRRAGQLDDDQPAVRADDTSFVFGEDSAPDPMPDPIKATPPSVEIESKVQARPLVRLERTNPIEVPRGSSADDVRISDVVSVLFRRRWQMAAVVAAFVAAAMAYNYLATPLYDARARLLIEPTAPDVVPFRGGTEDPSRLDYFVTQIEVLRSRGLAKKTLEQLQLLSTDPARQSAQVGALLGGLTVAPVKSANGDTRVIDVTIRSKVPETAAQLANGLAQTYVDQNLEGRRKGSRDAAEWLKGQLTELRKEMDTSEGALQRYREQKAGVSLGDDQNIVAQKLGQLSSAVTTARTARVEKQIVYEQLNAMQASGTQLDTFSPILANPFIQGLKAELASLQRDRRKIGEQLGELHPEMIAVNTAIANAERRLNEEMAKVVEGVQNEYRAAQANERGLGAALEEQKGEVLRLSQQSIAFGGLQRDATSTQQMFEAVRQRIRETELSSELQSNNVRVLETAEVPRGSTWPRAQLNLILALLGGGVFAVGLVLGLEHLDPRLSRPQSVIEALGLPLLGITPRIPGLKNRRAPLGALSPAYEEALRGIRARIFLSPIATVAQSMAVTSTNPGEGKTMVAANLAVSMARAGRRVLLIDADLRRPQLHDIFSIARSPGLSDVMTDATKPSEALRETAITGLFILSAGTDMASSTDVLDGERLPGLIDGFSRVFDVIVLDCPPVLGVADASILANAASSVLFVVGSGRTTREAAQAAVGRLLSVNSQVVGIVLNNAQVDHRSEYGYPAAYSKADTERAASREAAAKRVAEPA